MRDIGLALGFGVLVVIATLAGAEGLLRVLPADLLPKRAQQSPPFVEKDQVNIVYRKHNFRGKRPCKDCPEDLVRILAMGGSSTMGIPMLFAGRTYSAELQRLLDERRPGERYEVLNGGIGGFGITQVYSALKEELLKYKPDIVTISCWFNDTAPSPGWYSIPGLSDWEGYHEARRLQEIGEMPVVKFVRGTRLYAAARHYLLASRAAVLGRATTKKRKRRPRMTPSEFHFALEEIAKLGKEHGFLLVLVTEAKSRSADWTKERGRNSYLEVMEQFANDHGFPLVDTLTPLSERRDQWLFYDFIHPNPAGHGVIAEAMYDELFRSAPKKPLEALWNKKNVDYSRPEAVKKVHLQLERAPAVNSSLTVEARVPFLQEGAAKLVVSGDGYGKQSFSGLSSEFRRFEIPLGDFSQAPPIADYFLHAEIVRDLKAGYPVGNTGMHSPTSISLKSGGKDYGWTVEMRVAGVRHDQDFRGYNAVIIGARSGKVLHSTVFDVYGNAEENKRLHNFLFSLKAFYEEGTPPIVAFAVKTDGRHNADEELLLYRR